MRTIASFMARHVWLGWLLAAPVWYFLATWVMDRYPPFEVLSVEPVHAKAGTSVTLKAKVRRDLWRECDAKFTRSLIDSQFVRYDLEGEQTATSKSIAAMDRRTPGELYLSVYLPQNMPPGRAALQTSISYRCNVVHLLYPIQVQTEMPFEVVP